MHGRQLVTRLGMAASPGSRGPLPPLAARPVPHRPAARRVAVHRQMPRRPTRARGGPGPALRDARVRGGRFGDHPHGKPALRVGRLL